MINEAQIEETLNGLFENPGFAAEPAGLYDPLRYMIGIGGKRVRPRLCLTAYSLFKDSFSEEILQPAAAQAFDIVLKTTILSFAFTSSGVKAPCMAKSM